MMKLTMSTDDEMLRIQKQIVKNSNNVLYKAMNKMMNLAATYCPVDTGMLKNSITLTPIMPGSDVYDLTDGVFYGVYVEYGTRFHNQKLTKAKKKELGITKGGQMAQPFFRPALHEVNTVWLPMYMKE